MLGILSSRPQAEDTLLAVHLDQAFTQNLRQFSGCGAAHGIHLPEAVLGGDVSLGEEQVLQRGGFDGGDAVAVADHAHFCRDSRHRDPTFQLRQRGAGDEVQPRSSGQDRQQEQRNHDRQNLDQWAFGAADFGQGSSGRH